MKRMIVGWIVSLAFVMTSMTALAGDRTILAKAAPTGASCCFVGSPCCGDGCATGECK